MLILNKRFKINLCRAVTRIVFSGQDGLRQLVLEAEMCARSGTCNESYAMTPEEVQGIRDAINSFTGYWRVCASFGPGPDSPESGDLWTYLFWVGPPGSDIVPAIAVSRNSQGYRLTIYDLFEYCSERKFETFDFSTFAEAVKVLRGLVDEFADNALELSWPSESLLIARLQERHGGLNDTERFCLEQAALKSAPRPDRHS